MIESKKSEVLAILADYDNIDLTDFYGDIGFVDKVFIYAMYMQFVPLINSSMKLHFLLIVIVRTTR